MKDKIKIGELVEFNGIETSNYFNLKNYLMVTNKDNIKTLGMNIFNDVKPFTHAKILRKYVSLENVPYISLIDLEPYKLYFNHFKLIVEYNKFIKLTLRIQCRRCSKKQCNCNDYEIKCNSFICGNNFGIFIYLVIKDYEALKEFFELTSQEIELIE